MSEALPEAAPPEPRPRRWTATVLTLAGLFLLPFLCYLPATLLRGVFYFHDVQYYWYPYHALSAALFERGELPLWNPGAFSGIPYVGDGQNALFYPPNWLFFLFAPDRIFNHVVILQFSLAGLSMYACLREISLRRDAAILGAVSFMFCGFLTARALQLSIMASASLIPLVFFCLHRFSRLGGARWFALSGVAIALQVLTGHPQVPIYTGVAMLGFVLLQGWEKQQHDRQEGKAWLWRAPAVLVGIYAFGYAFAAIQLVPWFELARFSPRAAGASYDFIFRNSATPYDWLLLLFPYAFGSVRLGLFGTEVPPSDLGSRLWEHSVYVGLLPLALAALAGWQALALWRTRWRGRTTEGAPATGEAGLTRHQQHLAVYFTLVVLVAMILSCGRYTPLSHLLYRTPVVGKFRDVERFMALADFALAALAAFGLHGLGNFAHLVAAGGRALSRRLTTLALVALVLPITLVAVLRLPAVVARARQDLLAPLRFDRANALVPIAISLLVAAILWWLRRHPATPRVRTALVGVVVLELGFYAANFNPLTDPDLFRRKPAVLEALKSDAPFRKATFLKSNDLENETAKELLAVSWGMTFGIDDVNGFNSLQPRRYTDYVFGADMEDVSYGKMPDRRLLRRESPILSSLNVKYLLVPQVLQPRLGSHFKLSYQNDEVKVYENAAAYPRAFFTESWQAATDPKAILATVTADGFDGRKLALVEGPEAAGLPAPVGGDDKATVKMEAWGASFQRLTATTAAPRLLLTSEMHFPGWQAFIDGQKVPLLRANYLFRAVLVPAGTHEVVFRYRPGSLKLGGLVTGLALLATGIMVARRRRRASAPV